MVWTASHPPELKRSPVSKSTPASQTINRIDKQDVIQGQLKIAPILQQLTFSALAKKDALWLRLLMPQTIISVPNYLFYYNWIIIILKIIILQYLTNNFQSTMHYDGKWLFRTINRFKKNSKDCCVRQCNLVVFNVFKNEVTIHTLPPTSNVLDWFPCVRVSLVLT